MFRQLSPTRRHRGAERELAEHARADARERKERKARTASHARRPSFSERWLAERDLEQGADVDADSGLSDSSEA